MADTLTNLPISAVATAPSPATSGTSLIVTASEGAFFPATAFYATVCPAGTAPTRANAEIVRVTARSTDTMTITRAAGVGTTARTVVVGDQFFQCLPAEYFLQPLRISGGISHLLGGNGASSILLGEDTANGVLLFSNNGTMRFYVNDGSFTPANISAVGDIILGRTKLVAFGGGTSWFIDSGTADIVAVKSGLELVEMTAPAAPAANKGRLYLEDNGSGKTVLKVLFASGVAQVLATEP